MVGECDDLRAPVLDSMAVSDGHFGVMLTEIGICREIRKGKTFSRLLGLNRELRDTNTLFFVSLLCCHFITGFRLILNLFLPLHPPAMTFAPQHLFPPSEHPVQFPHCALPSSQVGENTVFPTELSNRQEPLVLVEEGAGTWVGALWLWTNARLL